MVFRSVFCGVAAALAGLSGAHAQLVADFSGRQPAQAAAGQDTAKDQVPVCRDSKIAAEKVRSIVMQEAERQGVDPKLALVVTLQESVLGAHVNSPAGARGIMQLMPETAARYGVSDICDPQQNAKGGISFLKDLYAAYGGNIFLILAAYNAGEKRVNDARGIPNIHETVNYVALAVNAYYRLDNSFRGGARSPLPHDMTDPSPTTDDLKAGTKIAMSVGRWVTGSVLYVGD